MLAANESTYWIKQLIWYGIGRLFIESLRSDSLYLGNYRISQIVSVIAIISGILIRIFTKEKKKVSNPINNDNRGGGMNQDGRI